MTLLLSSSDICKFMSMETCIQIMEQTFCTTFANPLRSVFKLPVAQKIAILGQMPAFVEISPIESYMCSKVISVYPGNHCQNLPSHQGVVLLFNGHHGELLSIMDAQQITAMRTAAVSALACKYLKPKSCIKCCILGTGLQAMQHAMAIPYVCSDLKQVVICGRSLEHAQHCVKLLEKESPHKHVEYVATSDKLEALKDADVICTVTSSKEPILCYKDLQKHDALVVAVGSCTPNARELDSELVKHCSHIIVDSLQSAHAEAGDLLIPLKEQVITSDNWQELSQVVGSDKISLRNESQLILFKSLGLAMEDLMCAVHLYKEAKQQGTGKEYQFAK